MSPHPSVQYTEGSFSLWSMLLDLNNMSQCVQQVNKRTRGNEGLLSTQEAKKLELCKLSSTPASYTKDLW